MVKPECENVVPCVRGGDAPGRRKTPIYCINNVWSKYERTVAAVEAVTPLRKCQLTRAASCGEPNNDLLRAPYVETFRTPL